MQFKKTEVFCKQFLKTENDCKNVIVHKVNIFSVH